MILKQICFIVEVLKFFSPLSSLPSFKALWLKLLDTMDKYLHTDRSDLLSEAIPESLKNMILVMDSTGIFASIPQIYELTTTRMSVLLPELLAEVMPGPPVIAWYEYFYNFFEPSS